MKVLFLFIFVFISIQTSFGFDPDTEAIVTRNRRTGKIESYSDKNQMRLYNEDGSYRLYTRDGWDSPQTYQGLYDENDNLIEGPPKKEYSIPEPPSPMETYAERRENRRFKLFVLSFLSGFSGVMFHIGATDGDGAPEIFGDTAEKRTKSQTTIAVGFDIAAIALLIAGLSVD